MQLLSQFPLLVLLLQLDPYHLPHQHPQPDLLLLLLQFLNGHPNILLMGLLDLGHVFQVLHLFLVFDVVLLAV